MHGLRLPQLPAEGIARPGQYLLPAFFGFRGLSEKDKLAKPFKDIKAIIGEEN